jgi:hypothetical protein
VVAVTSQRIQNVSENSSINRLIPPTTDFPLLAHNMLSL